MNGKELFSLIMPILTAFASAFLAFTGNMPWDTAIGLITLSLGAIGIHPAVNTTPVAGRVK